MQQVQSALATRSMVLPILITGAGVLGGAAMVVGGVGCGVAQVGRGLMQVPGAARARREEKVWDQELGCWVDVDLCALEKQVAEDAEKGEATATGVGE
ncbi:Vps13c, partial [Symbiodinium sp. CCMP2456]